MYRLILIIFLSGFVKCYSQISEGGIPKSFHTPVLKKTNAVPVYSLKSIDTETILYQEGNPADIPYKYSTIEKVNINLKEISLRQDVPEADGTIWRLIIRSPDAISLQLIFSDYVIPDGANLFVYNDSGSDIYGAFTNRNMLPDSTFTIADFKGSSITLEYFEPYDILTPGKLVIGMVGKAFRDIIALNEKSIDEFGINGYDGREIQNHKHSVEKITFMEGNSGFACTGTLMNNVKNDGTPYLLTASHCISTSEGAATLVAYFNHEDPFTGEEITLNNTVTGSTLLSTGKSSDYTLLLLSAAPPVEFQPFYSGWDISENTGSKAFSIHHAGGGLKKVTYDLAPPVSYDKVLWWGGSDYSPSGSHWQVEYDLGATMVGSSGAPLFNDFKRVIGQLHGGDNIRDFFGKLSYSWTRSQTGKTLKFYLDPDGTDTLYIDGYYPSGNTPDANFFTEYTRICTGSSIVIEDGSAFDPENRKWDISPGGFEFINGTGPLSLKPEIRFNQPGNYSVQLIVENTAGKDTIRRTDFIKAGDEIRPKMYLVNSLDSCLCSFDSLTVMARGASDYLWSVKDTANFYSTDNTGNIFVIKGHNIELPDSIKGINISLIASQDGCRDTMNLDFPLISQPNDKLVNATEIVMGINGPFSNNCATVELLEPVPPHFSCTDQLSWCNETGVDILMNTVWFKFTAPSSGIISLSSEGLDNEIAIYYADKYEDIFAGKSTLLAANDDRSSVDYNPVIYGISVTPGKTYYVQADGSGGGMEGYFYLTLDNKAIISGNNSITETRLKIYPLPAGDFIVLQLPGPGFNGNTNVEIYNMTGSLVYNALITETGPTCTIPVDYLTTGVYIIRILNSDKYYYGRIIK